MKNYIPLVFCLLAIDVAYSQTDSSTAYYQKGLTEKNSGLFMVASQDLEKAIKFDPKNLNAYLQDGYANTEMHRTDVAKADFQNAYNLDPSNAEAIKQLTQIYYSYHQYEQAIDFAKKCNTCDNSERIIAMCSYQQEDYGTTIKDLQDVLQKNPNDAEATYTMARSYLELEEYVQAVPWYQKAVQLDPTKNVWMYELGLLYYNNDDFKDAVIFIDKAVATGYRKTNDVNENLGFACIYTGDFDRGERLLLDLLSKRPGDKDLIRGIAEAYYSVKMYDKSLEFCQQLMQLDAKDGRALYQAGLCFQKKGDKDKGEQMCDHAIEIDPSLASLRQKKSDMMGL